MGDWGWLQRALRGWPAGLAAPDHGPQLCPREWATGEQPHKVPVGPSCPGPSPHAPLLGSMETPALGVARWKVNSPLLPESRSVALTVRMALPAGVCSSRVTWKAVQRGPAW